jgi:hypothetical protein
MDFLQLFKKFAFKDSDVTTEVFLTCLQAGKEIGKIFYGEREYIRQTYFQNKVEFKDEEKICVICYQDLDIDESIIKIHNIPSTGVGKHHVAELMKERNIPMPLVFNYDVEDGMFEERAQVGYATAEEADYVVERLKSNPLQVRGNILEFELIRPDTPVLIRTKCGHIFCVQC